MLKNPYALGILLALLNAFFLAAMSFFMKMLTQFFQPPEVVFFRGAFACIAILLWLGATQRLNTLKTQRPMVHLFRGALGTAGIVMGAWALSLMPLAETTIMFFTAPLFVVILSAPILKERVGIKRFSAVAFGFFGIVVMKVFDVGGVELPLIGIFAGLAWGFIAGSVDVCLRWMGKTEDPTRTVFYFMFFGMIVTGLHWPWAEVAEGGWSINAFWIIIALGLTGLLSQIVKTQSLQLVEASVLAPITFSMIIWTMLFDYVFWHKVPTWNVVLGAVIIISSNLFILYRENTVKRHTAP